MSSVPADTALTETNRTVIKRTANSDRGSASSSSSPAGEEGDDGEGGVMGVGEHVLDEKVGLAAVLWAGQRSHDISNTQKQKLHLIKD